MVLSALPFIALSLIHITGEALVKTRPELTRRIRYLTKPLLMPALALLYLLNSDNASVFLLAAMAGGWMGDLFLMIPDDGEKKLFFKLGLVSFLAGHLFYAVAFMKAGSLSLKSPAAIVCALAILFYCAYVFIKLRPHMGKLFAPITVYIVFISLMGISVTLCFSTQQLSAVLTALSGAAIFMISDTINAWNRFAGAIPHERELTMSTYLAGQFLLVLGYMAF